MGDAAATIQGNKNVIQTTGGTIASIGLEQSGKKIAGVLVTPATWALNYAADGSKPNAVDIGIWASGFLSAPAAIVSGFLKAAVDDDINRKLALVQAKEPSKSARFIKACTTLAQPHPRLTP